MQGVVKWFSETKGFGFIESDNKEYFVHFRSIVCDGFKTLNAGERVEFDTQANDKGPCAVNVKRIV